MTQPAEGVTVHRDEYGIPRIEAETERLAWFGLGWAAAQDRLWQLEYDRRRARGRWAEVVGSSALPADRLARRLQLTDAAENDLTVMDPATAETFEAYADGVNGFVADMGLPSGYELAGVSWETWTPLDSLLAFKIRHLMMGVWQYKIARAVLRATAGDAVAGILDPRPLPGMRVTVPPLGRIPDDDPRAALLEQARDDVERAAAHLGFLAEAEGGSNAWVIGPERSTTGYPILANDSHRALEAPNTYWQAHLSCPEFTVSGATFPGVPGFPHFGHNGRVGWAITNAAADTQDLYVEHFRPGADGLELRTAEGWVPATSRDERVLVRGGAEHVETCWRSPNGPVVHGEPATGAALSLRWTATAEPCAQFGVFRAMLVAGSARAMLDAQEEWVDPLNNLVVADVDGHIGYLLRGLLPERADLAATQVPVPGWDGTSKWRGRVPFARMPRIEDPIDNIIVTANNTVTPDEQPFVSHSMNDAYRVERIHELAVSARRLGPEDMIGWQGDTTSVAARRWSELLANRGPFSGAAESARVALVAGAGDLRGDDSVGLIHAGFRRAVARRVLDREIGADATKLLLGNGLPGLPVVLRRWFAGLTWPRDDGTWPARALDDGLLADALESAWLSACESGRDGVPPQWADVHRTAARHPLYPLTGTAFDPPVAGIGGDNETIQNGAYGWAEGTPYSITNLSVYRQVLDFADLSRSGWIVPGGASGDPGDAHYADQLGIWARHRLAPMHPRSPAAGESDLG
jgi:penicillin amidase